MCFSEPMSQCQHLPAGERNVLCMRQGLGPGRGERCGAEETWTGLGGRCRPVRGECGVPMERDPKAWGQNSLHCLLLFP